MKQMIYTFERDNEILDVGTIDGYDYVIMSYGTHPCAYVKTQNEQYVDENDIDVHGGITFNGGRDFGCGRNHYIGWDYAHCGDYCGLDMMLPPEYITDDKKWTTEEILEDVKDVIKQLKKQREEYEVEE